MTATSASPGLSIDVLPNELLTCIFRHCRNSSLPSVLVNCLLVCQRWKDMVLPILYHDILLTNANIHIFNSNIDILNSNPESNAWHVRSITVNICPVSDQQGPEMGQLWELLRSQLLEILRRTKKLRTFSFIVRSNDRPRPHGMSNSFWMPRTILGAIIDSLPKSCVSVEMITDCWDHPEYPHYHFCCSIGRIIHRLRHLHLQVSTAICPLVFGQVRAQFSNAVASKMGSPNAPFLESLVLNCMTMWHPRVRLCGTTVEPRESLVDNLHQIISRGGLPSAKRVFVVDCSSADEDSEYRTIHRRDIVQNKTLSIPFAYFGHDYSSSRNYWFARFLEGPDIVSDDYTLVSLAEGRPFVETISGIRLPNDPVDIVPRESDGHNVRPINSLSKEECISKGLTKWSARNVCALWENEKKCGVRLLEAEYIDGISTTAFVEEKMTVPGWVRNGTILHNAEEGFSLLPFSLSTSL